MAHVGEPPAADARGESELSARPRSRSSSCAASPTEPNERSRRWTRCQNIRQRTAALMTGADRGDAGPRHGLLPVNNTGPPPPLAGWHPTGPPMLPLQAPVLVTPAPMTSPMRLMYRFDPCRLPGVTGSHTGMGMIRTEHSGGLSGVIEAKPRSARSGALQGCSWRRGGRRSRHAGVPPGRPADRDPILDPGDDAFGDSINGPGPFVVRRARPRRLPGSASSGEPEPEGHGRISVTEPPGATIKESGKELCAPTPCDVTFKADDAAKTHRGSRSSRRASKSRRSPSLGGLREGLRHQD